MIDGRPDKFRIKIWNKDKKNQVVYDKPEQHGGCGGPSYNHCRLYYDSNQQSCRGPDELARRRSNPRRENRTYFPQLPNPFSEKTTLEFTFDEDEEYTLAIYDLAGKLVANCQMARLRRVS
ncbi:hypothetical protein AHMF7605_29300 [Adhaeribacter arboris]|uniref:Secretion system C-terminal sorting domain-containing protein n=1 Tax=Adhaeribacter arboris TaxID=2072846 RepID=A0A2T2Y915_9BACT|nr:T9SS type A sorting domain-containing protein [Adhaeribacter arboris]PSR52004.1 hypothetical protein AHMF7605_29300 [Adhaeribacter arboris]